MLALRHRQQPDRVTGEPWDGSLVAPARRTRLSGQRGLGKDLFRKGFSLIELLIVVGVLALIGGAVLLAFGDVESDASDHLAAAEMQQVKEAVLRFYRDTGYLPKQGPFTRGNVDTDAAGVSAAWFASPANVDQLYRNPLDGTGAGTDATYGALAGDLKSYDVRSRRGWNGPYLTDGPRRYVDLGDGLNPSDGSGSPASGALMVDVPMVADPYLAKPTAVGAVSYYETWKEPSAVRPSGDKPLSRVGRPYVLLGLENGPKATGAGAPRIVGLGPNGRYEQGGGDDVTLFLFQ